MRAAPEVQNAPVEPGKCVRHPVPASRRYRVCHFATGGGVRFKPLAPTALLGHLGAPRRTFASPGCRSQDSTRRRLVALPALRRARPNGLHCARTHRGYPSGHPAPAQPRPLGAPLPCVTVGRLRHGPSGAPLSAVPDGRGQRPRPGRAAPGPGPLLWGREGQVVATSPRLLRFAHRYTPSVTVDGLLRRALARTVTGR
jgi:hypothetical protein